MINIVSLIQVKAFARQDGVLLALLWVASFACLIYLPQSPWCNILALSTPLLVGWRLVKFRNYALDGIISLRRGYAYSVYTFLYASLIFAIAQYLYFRFLDGGTFLSLLTTAINALAPAYQANGITREMLNDNIAMVSSITPIEWAFVFMLQNIVIAFIVSLPIAAVCTRRSSKTSNIKEQHNS